MMAGIIDIDKAEIPTLGEFISAHSTDTDFRTAFVSVKKSSTLSNVYRDEVFVRVSPLDCALQQGVPASTRPRFIHLRHYSALAGHAC